MITVNRRKTSDLSTRDVKAALDAYALIALEDGRLLVNPAEVVVDEVQCKHVRVVLKFL